VRSIGLIIMNVLIDEPVFVNSYERFQKLFSAASAPDSAIMSRLPLSRAQLCIRVDRSMHGFSQCDDIVYTRSDSSLSGSGSEKEKEEVVESGHVRWGHCHHAGWRISRVCWVKVRVEDCRWRCGVGEEI
jgi:hypothetical protein